MDRQRVEQCLLQVSAYQASGQKAKVWAAANGVALGTLGSWCAHAGRWRARLESVGVSAPATPGSSGFVAARVGPATPVAATATATIRVELNAGATRVELHWPMANTRELAAMLRDFAR